MRVASGAFGFFTLIQQRQCDSTLLAG